MKKARIFLPLCLVATLLTGCRGQQTADPANDKDSTEQTADSLAANAAEVPTEDSLKKVVLERTLRTNQMDDDLGDFIYSLNSVDLEWPEALAACRDIQPLHDSLQSLLFGKLATKELKTSVDRYLQLPLFAELSTEPIPFSVVKKENVTDEGGFNMWSKSLQLRLLMTSPELAVFRILESSYSGGAHGMYGVSHLTFDRTNGRVWPLKEVFGQHRKAVLQQVNQQIERMNRKENRMLNPASELTNYFPNKEGITFVFQPYEIGCYAEGAVEVTVPYANLKDFFHPVFKTLIEQPEQFEFNALN